MTDVTTCCEGRSRAYPQSVSTAFVCRNRNRNLVKQAESIGALFVRQQCNSYELLTRMHRIGLTYRWVPINLVHEGGVPTTCDMIQCLRGGASATMIATALVRRGAVGVGHIPTDRRNGMAVQAYTSASPMHGAISLGLVPYPAGFPRGNQMRVLRQRGGPW